MLGLAGSSRKEVSCCPGHDWQGTQRHLTQSRESPSAFPSALLWPRAGLGSDSASELSSASVVLLLLLLVLACTLTAPLLPSPCPVCAEGLLMLVLERKIASPSLLCLSPLVAGHPRRPVHFT